MKAVKKATLVSNKWMNSLINSCISRHFPLKKGEFVAIKLPKKYTAIIACPGCGEKKPLRSHTLTMNGGKYTVDPSINNDTCCGWHGWLKNGEFILA